MTCASIPAIRRRLRAGQALSRVDGTRLWRVAQGVLGVALEPGDTDHDVRTQFLALPGDLIGTDPLAGSPLVPHVFAVTAAELEAVPCADTDQHHALLQLAYAQSRRQGREILRLRTGLVADRVKQMLLLLGQPDADSGETEVELPSLRRLADLLDASPEAICRVLGRLRQLEVLLNRRPHRARLSTHALHALVPPAGMSSSLPGLRFEAIGTA